MGSNHVELCIQDEQFEFLLCNVTRSQKQDESKGVRDYLTCSDSMHHDRDGLECLLLARQEIIKHIQTRVEHVRKCNLILG